MKEGVFWVVPRKVQHNYKILYEFNGILGHSDIWQTVILKNEDLAQYEYDYFPRGRVWIKDRKATIFLSSLINNSLILQQISEIFELNENYEVYEDT